MFSFLSIHKKINKSHHRHYDKLFHYFLTLLVIENNVLMEYFDE